MFKKDLNFPGQYKNERIILLLRRHWFILATKIASLIFFVLAILAAYYLLLKFLPGITESDFYPVIVVVLIAAGLFIWAKFFGIWNDYYLDVWIVTTDRIINIEQQGMFRRIASEQKMNRVQDITTEIKGLFPTIINYGHVYVQTASTRERFVFEQVPRPYEVKKIILDLHDKYIKKYGDQVLAEERREARAEVKNTQQN